VSEELSLTMEALEDLYRARAVKGWDVRVYDYTSNTWKEAEEAFSTPGTYERAVLTGPGTRPIRVRVLPRGASGLKLEATSAMEMAVWRTLGIGLQGRHLDLISRLLVDHDGPVTIEELAGLLVGSEDPLAKEVLHALAPLLPTGVGDE
jgi:hypothetical protein